LITQQAANAPYSCVCGVGFLGFFCFFFFPLLLQW